MYADLCELLAPGFLSASIDLEGHRYCLRSLSQNDLFFLRKYVNDNDPSWRLHLISHSIWMVDGVPLLEDATLAHRVVYDHLKNSSRVLVRAMMGTVLGFFSRMREANQYLEAYLYEEDSRRMWGGLGHGAHPLWVKSSIPGTDKLGLNSLQSAWISWNQSVDVREEQEYLWSNTKVMVSLQSHKAYESLTSKDKARDDREEARRQTAKEKAYQRFLHGDAENLEESESARATRTLTNEELEEEMRRWISGDMDRHDLIVESYKNRIRQEQEERERQKEELMQELRSRRESEEEALGTPKPTLTAVSPEQIAEMFKGAKSGAKFITEADPVSRTFNRYLRNPVNPGNLSVDSTGHIVEAAPVVPEPVSLNDQIASRKVVLHDD